MTVKTSNKPIMFTCTVEVSNRQGKRKIVRNNEEFEMTEFELAGSNCTRVLYLVYPYLRFAGLSVFFLSDESDDKMP